VTQNRCVILHRGGGHGDDGGGATLFESPAGAGSQDPRPRIPIGTGSGGGSAEAPFIMSRKIRRPTGDLHAGPAARIGQGSAHLADRRLGKLPAEAGIRGARVGQSGDQKYRRETSSNKSQPVCHVAFPQGDPDSAAEASIADRKA